MSFLLPVKELLIYFSLHNDVICTFLRFLPCHILHLFEIFFGANIHLFEIFSKLFGKNVNILIVFLPLFDKIECTMFW